jgi:hypothetical protein
MALVWSKEKVALQIDDDPASEPFCGPDDWTVIHVTTDQLGSFEGCQEVVDHLSRALGAGLSPDGDGCLPDADEMPWRLGAMGTLGLPWEVPVPSDDLEEALGGACFGALGDAGGDTGFGALGDAGFGALGDAEADPSEDWPEERVDWDDRLPEGSVRIIRGRRMSTPMRPTTSTTREATASSARASARYAASGRTCAARGALPATTRPWTRSPTWRRGLTAPWRATSSCC